MKISIQELLVVFIVALVVVGPDKLPMYAKKLGMALAQFRKFSEDATKDIRESIVEPLEEAQRPLREAMEPITELEKSVKSNVKDIQQSFADIGKPKASPDSAAGKEISGQSGEKKEQVSEETAASVTVEKQENLSEETAASVTAEKQENLSEETAASAAVEKQENLSEETAASAGVQAASSERPEEMSADGGGCQENVKETIS